MTWVREANYLVGSGVSRVLLEPGVAGAVAATLTGLWQRPGAGGADFDWERISGTPFDDLDDECADVLWTAQAGARPARLWVWVQNGRHAGLWVRAVGAADFSHVECPGSRGRRAVLSAATPADQVWVFADQPDDTTVGPTAAHGAAAVARASFSRALQHPMPDDWRPCQASSDDVREGFVKLQGGALVKPVTYCVVDGRAIFEGDVDLGSVKDMEAISKKMRKRLVAGQGLPGETRDLPLGVQRGVAVTGDAFRWPGGLVPWDAQSGLRAGAGRHRQLGAAFAHQFRRAHAGEPGALPELGVVPGGRFSRINLFDNAPAFIRYRLFARDRHTCAYCAQVFGAEHLKCEHILPISRGGLWEWMKLVAACRLCNHRKSCRTPEEAGMKLVYLPYVPSRLEDFLLRGRNIRADVHEWLASRLPKGSRLT